MKKISELREIIENQKIRSAWDKAVKEYALELIEEMDSEKEFHGSPADRKELLNGADNWNHYSWGGCSLCYDADIAKRVCSPSEFKKKKEGEHRPNINEEWLDVQTRVLNQAERMILRLCK